MFDFFFGTQKQAWSSLDIVLRRRGHAIVRVGDLQKTLFWNAATSRTLMAMGQFEYVRYFGSDPLGIYMDKFKEYSFRKMVIRIIAAGAEGLTLEVLRESTGRRTEEYLRLLEALQAITRENGRVRWARSEDNIGPSLEHFVSSLCLRELGASAAEWNVVLEDVPDTGGDYDVIASLDPNLLYIECKSGRTNNISDAQLRETLRRNEALAPELSILLIDTDGPVLPVVERMNLMLRNGAYPEESNMSFPVDSEFEEIESMPGIYFGNAQCYVVNSQPSILRQIRSCLRHYHAVVKPTGGYSFDAESFLRQRRLPETSEESTNGL